MSAIAMPTHRIQLPATDTLRADRVADGRTANATGMTATAPTGSGKNRMMTPTAVTRRFTAFVTLAAETGRNLLRREFATPTAPTLGIGHNQQL